MVSSCREWFAPSDVRFETIGSWPPLPCEPSSVDLVVAYSVFSHLPENVATAWMAEFLRVLKPGGLVVATTQSRSFIDLCEHIRHDPSYRDSDFVWFQLLARSFQDVAGSRERFDRGEFLHEANGGGDDSLANSVYGDSLFGRRYIEQRWAHLLELVRFDDKPFSLPQACFVLRKRKTWPSPSSIARAYTARAWLLARRAGHAARDPVGTAHKVRQRLAPGSRTSANGS
jgi:SAM-dependent methyltransferase